MKRSGSGSAKTDRSHSRRPPGDRPPTDLFSIDVADPRYFDSKFWLAARTDLLGNLMERDPGDPGELSGAVLRLGDTGEYAILTVDIGGSHCLGWLAGWPLRDFLRRALARVLGDGDADTELEVALGELYPEAHPWRPSGGVLRCSGVGPDTELGCYFGAHCFGIACGFVLWEFLRKATVRATMGITEVEVGRAVGLTDSDREFLRDARISTGEGGL